MSKRKRSRKKKSKTISVCPRCKGAGCESYDKICTLCKGTGVPREK